jgi:hypothetical protein
MKLLTPAQQAANLRQAISELDAQIDQRKTEMVESQTGMLDGELDDDEIVALHGMRKKLQADLDRLA